MAGDPRPLLVVLRALGLGDLLTAVPALRGLAAAFPDHRRVLLVPRALEPLLALAGGVADEVVDLDFRDGVRRQGADEAPIPPDGLRHPAVAVNLHGRGPESHRALRDLAPTRLLGFAQSAAGHDGPVWRDDEHEVHRWCRLLATEGVPADPADLRIARPAVAPPSAAVGATVLHPGAASAARRWPVERWAAVARAEQARGRPVVVTGSTDERALAAAVADLARLPAGAVLAGSTDLPGLTATVAAADRVLCGDTGVAHLATALGRPSVVLFGPTPPSEWGPPAAGPHVALWAGRRGDPHGTTPDAGLLEITVDDVLAAADGLPTVGIAADRTAPGGAGESGGGAPGRGTQRPGPAERA